MLFRSESVFTTPLPRAPAEVAKVTGTAASALPLRSRTLAVMIVEPPLDEMVLGFALRLTRPTAAVPSEILRAPLEPVVAPPDEAVTVAIPLFDEAKNVTVVRPLTSVVASAGLTLPSVVVNVM